MTGDNSQLRTLGLPFGRILRPSSKVLPEHARMHNRALVLQMLYTEGGQSRADLARGTGLTRVTISELVAGLVAEGLVVETGQRGEVRPGKPATLLDIDRGAFQIVGVDLSDHRSFRGAVLDLDGRILSDIDLPLDMQAGEAAVDLVLSLVQGLLDLATAPVLGIGIGSPGIVDLGGVVLSAPNLGWTGVALQERLVERFGRPVIVANDANVAVLAEHSFGEARADFLLVKVGHGVGAGLLLAGAPYFGAGFAAGEIGHVVVRQTGDLCACGKSGCLETWLAAPHLEAALATAATPEGRDAILTEAGHQLGVALAPVVGALNLSEIILSGPAHLLGGVIVASASDTIRARTVAEFHGDLRLRLTDLGEDIVVRGAAAMVLFRELGVS
ncbi:MAG: ROK family transcriptional regulator [Burkholderiaceae bacterium]|nr:ROK family transcriptional regulator [Microbacteriaceae bacterium]